MERNVDILMKRVFIFVILVLSLIMSGCSGRQPNNQNATTNLTTNITGSTNTGGTGGSNAGTVTGNAPGVTQTHTFTPDDLKNYNGQNGKPAYVAVNGLVYDVTNSDLWKAGVHKYCSDTTYAGADYSELINSSPHGADILKSFPVVGVLKK